MAQVSLGMYNHQQHLQALADDSVGFPADIRKLDDSGDEEWIAEIRELTQENKHWEALLQIADRVGPSVRVEVGVAIYLGWSRLGMLRKLCLQLPNGWHVYRAC